MTEKITVRIDLFLTPAEFDHFDRLGILSGFTREDPRKRWRKAEKRECVRTGVACVLNENFEKERLS